MDKSSIKNLTWSGMYLRRNFPNDLLQKLLIMVPLTETRPKVCVTFMTTFLSDSYYDLEETHKLVPAQNVQFSTRALI